MKRILYSLLSIGVISTIVVFVSNAFFSDTETSTGNVFKAGKVDLLVDSICSYNGQPSDECGTWGSINLTSEKFFNFSDIKPGDYGENTISLKVDNNPSWLCMTISPTANDDVNSTEPELEEIGETSENPFDILDGELRQNLIFHIWADVCDTAPAVPGDDIYQADCDKEISNNVFEGLTPLTLADSTQNAFTGNAGEPINGNQNYYLGFGWSLPSEVGNVVQTDNFIADILFQAEQSRNNNNFVCPKINNVFFDDFNDDNADGWWLGYALKDHLWGNWRVKDGILIQDTGDDGVMALIENHQFSSQTIETKVRVDGPSGGGGVILWFQEDNNLVAVTLSGNGLEAAENINGTWSNTNYPYPPFIFGTWYELKVVADSTSGNLDIYLDGNYLITHTMNTPNRTGQSGVINGNAGGAFDNFSLISN
ncbi:hypothetical protein A2961_04175 [Candidatus Woesebacteria bacterium RIFCSPLOWO2_01_FULL_39_21]|uniref:3-keto-disaccharide hydrolase domain-containing protein n=1 Tax=Candidatus Woesebacteria bacterium RIFCSPLOWO2_01_FULL_39_21 TaxID=1802519 RepID=A0A1F8BBT7_9BACT|nr:MAG: hypothetical protein A2961_04175 [Candidatus Woesebacteria bacterium RIFCSPLOWO2_01_FULL_39_21]